MDMNLIQRTILISGCVLIILNLLYPPRTYEYNAGAPVPRAFLFSEDFDKTDITPVNEQHGSLTIVETSNPAVLSKDRMWIYTVIITAAMFGLYTFAGCFESMPSGAVTTPE